jgi:hypothetical protein
LPRERFCNVLLDFAEEVINVRLRSETVFAQNHDKSEEDGTTEERTEIDCNNNMLVAESQYSVHTRAVKERHYSSTAVRPVPETSYSPNLATSGEQNNLERVTTLRVFALCQIFRNDNVSGSC